MLATAAGESRCKRCSAPYQRSWSRLDRPRVTLTIVCPRCGTSGDSIVDGALAKVAHLLAPGSKEAEVLSTAIRAACDAADSAAPTLQSLDLIPPDAES